MSKSIDSYILTTRVLNYHWHKSKFISGVKCVKHNHEESCQSTDSTILDMNVKPRSHSLNYVSSDYESLDYENYESELTVREEKLNGYKTIVTSNLIRWLIYFSIAICTAAVGIFIDTVIEYLCNWKYQSIRNSIDVRHSIAECLVIWLLFTILPTIVGCSVVLFMEPSAAGSGIPFVISYLNGVRIPRMTAVRCLLVKVISVVCVCVAGLGGGKEGPLIHIGAMVGGSVVEAWWKSFRNGPGRKVIGPLQNDRERRDMMAAGAAAGLSAAFGSPIGGTLMSLEEGTSFWSSSLMWKVFFCAAIAFPTFNAGKNIMSTNHTNTSESLYFFGKFKETPVYFSYSEFPIFILFGIFGGALGALFVNINYRLSIFRMKHIISNRKKLLESVFVAMFVAITSLTTMVLLSYCQLRIEISSSSVIQIKFTTKTAFTFMIGLLQMNCPAGSYNEMSVFWLHAQEENIRSLFHYPIEAFSIIPLLVYCVVYFILTELTVGLNVSAGLFLPTLLIGAAWGRVASKVIHHYLPDIIGNDPAKYAVLGAAAQLGGIVRATISITVVFIEATGNVQFLLPLMITLFAAKWTGDFFTDGIYEMQIKLSGIPLLVSEPPPLTSDITAEDYMSDNVCAIPHMLMVGKLVEILNTTKHNGFPVVASKVCFCRTTSKEHKCYGLLNGFILRSQLNVILRHNLYLTPLHDENYCTKLELIRKSTYTCDDSQLFQRINIDEEERSIVIDLRPYMNSAPYIIRLETSLSRTFRLFRTLGLRHIVVINNTNEVVGIITRKDLAKFRLWRKAITMGLKELNVY